MSRNYEQITLEQASQIPGNAAPEAKHIVANVIPGNNHTGRGFADSVGDRVKIVEVSVNKMKEDEVKMEARVVCEVVTSEGASPCLPSGRRVLTK